MNETKQYVGYLSAFVFSVAIFLILGLSTFVVWTSAKERMIDDAHTKFSQETELIVNQIISRADLYINALKAGNALFAASVEVSRSEWRAFAQELELQKSYPGIQGFGFSLVVTPDEIESHIADMHAEGFSDFTLRPPGERELYTSIVYLEPFDARNQQAFGFDMYSEITRRTAMDLARDSGSPQLSGGVTLVQEIDEDVQVGFLIYVPTYRNGADLTTIENRRDALLGYVYSPFRAKDFMSGILGARTQSVDFVVLDDSVQFGDEPLVLFDTSEGERRLEKYDQDKMFSKSETITIANHSWTILFTSRPGYWQNVHGVFAEWQVLASGLVISILVAGIIFSLLISRARAQVIVRTITGDLENFKLAVESATDGIIMVDTSMRIVYVNPAWEQMTGYTLAEVRGKNPNISKSGHTLTETYDELWDTVQSGSPYTTEDILNVTKDGRNYPVQLSIYPVKKNKEIAYFVGIERDITERKQIDTAKTEFVSLASHQLRTPLTAVEWNTELLLTEQSQNLSKEQTVSLQEIKAGTERMIELVESLLDTSRIELGTFSINPEMTDVLVLADTALLELHSSIAAKHLQVEKKYDVKKSKVIIDPQLVRMVVQNLLSNAVKYTPPEGKISLEIKTRDEELMIQVTDSGYGIPKSAQRKIFTKLFRAENVSTLDVGGTGLGLYIVKSLIDVAGGSIEFKSEEGKGTMFSVILPLV